VKLEHAFEVAASPDQTMALMLDAERVVPCMPGATLKEIVEPDTWKAEMGVKLGPVGMQFLVDVKMLERDDEAHSVKLGVSGRDTRGKGGAEGLVDSRLVAVEGGGTRVEMATDLRFSGQAAQLGRPSVVQDVSNKLVGQFADCLKAQLSASPEQAAEAVQEAGKPVSGLSLMLSALVASIKRFFGRGGGRKEGETA
jgi:carbon monoxide dehydrogenase subunit G